MQRPTTESPLADPRNKAKPHQSCELFLRTSREFLERLAQSFAAQADHSQLLTQIELAPGKQGARDKA